MIFADRNKRDIGVMSSFNFDMAFGDDENDFACTISKDNHCCQEGYFIYVEGTEYGGIVDEIKVVTADDSITYSGRTWHGILENKIISPEEGQDYADYEGEANTVLREIINELDLSELFVVPSIDSGLVINPFQMERYIPAYTGIRKMLCENDAKLKMFWNSGKVILQAVPRYDYSQDEEFNTAQVDFSLQRKYNPCNHMICLGSGDLKDRAVIHLFTDENGGIQPYSTCITPLRDSHYILNKSKQKLFGHAEIVKILDMSNADIAINYILTTTKPRDWDKRCENYFYRAETEDETDDGEVEYEYKNVKLNEDEVYVLQKYSPSDWSVNYPDYYIVGSDGEYEPVSSTTTYSVLSKKPSDWKTNYNEYFTKSGSNYNTVEGIENIKRTLQTKKPCDWKKKYSEYYEFYSDGVVSEYRNVSGVTKSRYVKQTQKPTDWEDNYSEYYKKKKTGGFTELKGSGAPIFKTNKYYKKKSNGRYELLKKKPSDWEERYSSYYTKQNTHCNPVQGTSAPTWKKNRYYTKQNYQVAPRWEKSKYYTESTSILVPTWKSETYYTKVDETPPTWSKNKYYTKRTVTSAPKWTRNTYYYAVEDRYAALVESGIAALEEEWKNDTLSIDLAETDQCYDIDDIVGAYEPITGLETIQNVSKKIVKISNDEITITYEVS